MTDREITHSSQAKVRATFEQTLKDLGVEDYKLVAGQLVTYAASGFEYRERYGRKII